MASSTLSAYAAVFSYPIRSAETISYTATWSNLGPLTTVFTPPASCNTPLLTNLFVQGRTTWAHDCGWTRTADLPRPDCYPSYTAPDPAAFAGGENFWLPGEQKFYYSPGYSCPAGWQPATTLMTPAPATLGIWDEGQRPLALLNAPGTQVLCCPNAWTLGGLVQCYSRVEISTTFSICLEQTRSSNHTNRPPATSRTTTMVAYTTPAFLLIHESAQAESSQSNSGNTTKIAVGIAVPVAILLAALAGVLFWFRRRKRRREYLHQPVVSDGGEEQHSAEVGAKKSHHEDSYIKPELDGSDANQRVLSHDKPELDGHSQPLLANDALELEDTGISGANEAGHNNNTPGGEVPRAGRHIMELEDTGRQELAYGTGAPSEHPSALQPPQARPVID
ncbi:Putative SKG6/AXL2 alpha-helix transmembrane domain-containing protein [Septoria linicola]|uniref:SKG6/AXL2 alpha-helix transmembrane domain-containing protein n=1 Tax=Septoria linicola TaxID=215465 RepID=A0A9Q9EM27_9PEZI|nr:putative SKG6/AXL2 alpha-helix transmembrane domain-containing protein [Septoria linicola]USW55004.1 Putative SKG6/AXL2 alpha-helix transmembrane domain-containing protein [Septoria linicola]